MQDQKIDNQLNLALSVDDNEREKGYDLDTGYDSSANTWEVIVRYNGDLTELNNYGIQITYLLGGYAVLIIPENLITYVASLPMIEYMEKPKSLYFAVNTAKADSCFYAIQGRGAVPGLSAGQGLYGKGTIVAVIDSGVDYRHPDFINDDGTTRILFLWDQSGQPGGLGSAPQGYNMGIEYNSADINNLISGNSNERGPSDYSGHGTHVLGIAAGNGRASRGRYTGCAPESDIIVVKLGMSGSGSFPMTSELIQAVDYVVRKAYNLARPLALNISYGNSYGSHDPYY